MSSKRFPFPSQCDCETVTKMFPGCCCSLDWKGRFREKIFQTRRITSSAGSNLVYPVRHGLPASTVTVDIPLTPGTTPARGGRLTGWWMVPTHYTVYMITFPSEEFSFWLHACILTESLMFRVTQSSTYTGSPIAGRITTDWVYTKSS